MLSRRQEAFKNISKICHKEFLIQKLNFRKKKWNNRKNNKISKIQDQFGNNRY